MTQTPRFCEQCGAPLNPGARFCGQCGQSVKAAAVAPAAPAPTAVAQSAPAPTPVAATAPASPGTRDAVAASGEPVLGVIAGLQRRKGLLGYETWSAVVTPRRIAFALLTKEMMNDAVRQSQAQAKREGKGFLGQMAAQLGWLQIIVDKYAAMTVEHTLSEQPDNYFFALNQIKRVKVEHRRDPRQHTTSDHVVFDTTSGRYEYELKGGGREEVRQLLASVLGGVVD